MLAIYRLVFVLTRCVTLYYHLVSFHTFYMRNHLLKLQKKKSNLDGRRYKL